MKIKLFLMIFLVAFLFAVAKGESKLSSASNFALDDLNGEKVELKELLNKGPVLISFWATTCKPCVRELNKMEEVYLELKEKGFTLLAVNGDGPRSISKVKSFVAGLKWSFPVLLDKDQKVFRLYKVRGLPHTVLIDKEYKIRYTHAGYGHGDEKKLREKIISLLEEKEGGNEK
jgi:cytochrome c biogenesis protein CcmG/thiol:disulfide interchange protein DsbE